MTYGTQAKRRLLVISYHFPPDGSIGGQRWAGLSKYLARLGWEVHVVTASSAKDQLLPDNVIRHFRERRRTFNDFYRSRAAARRSDPVVTTGQSRGARARTEAGSQMVAGARRLLGSSLALPDHGRGWVLRAALAARALLREKSFDCVVSSGPPHSAHFAGWLASIGTGVPFWIDMRDPWALTYEMNTPETSCIRIERRFLAWLERIVFPRAAKVLVNTREFADALRRIQPDLKVVHFPNGIDEEQLPIRDESAVEAGMIAYVGTLYANRDLSTVFSAMGSILDKGNPGAANLRLNVAGPLESPHRERMHAEIDSLGLGSKVSVLGVLPRDGALKLLSRAHLALVLAQEQPMCVPAKLYEAVGLGVPTLVIAEFDSAAAREANRIGARTVDPNDIAGMRSVLSDMLSHRIPKTIQQRAAISYEDLARNMDMLLVGETWELRSQSGVAEESLPHPV